MSHEDRIAMLYPEAEAISRVAKNQLEASILISQSDSDTHNEGFVLHGECWRSRYKCDGGRARGPWSVHSWCKAMLELPVGSEASLEEEARCTLRQFWHGVHTRGSQGLTPWHAGFSALAALPPDWIGAYERVRLMQKIQVELQHPPELPASGL